MHSVAEWTAQIPAEPTPRDGLRLIQTALADAKEATDQILARYTGGTLPLPPWPQHPKLVEAIKALEGGVLLLNQAIATGYGDKAEPRTKDGKPGPLATRLINGGRALYREVAVMQKAMQGVKVEDIPQLLASAAKKAAATPIGGLATFALILWGLSQLDDLE